MYKELNDGFFDIMLERILYEEMERELEAYPSEEELRKLFPYTKRQEKEVRRLKRILKHKGEKPTYIYFKRVAVILLCVITASFGLLMTDEGVRAAVSEKVKEITEKILPWSYKAELDDVIKGENKEKGYYEIAFDDVKVADREAAEEEFSIENIEVTYIPDGFELYENRENEIKREYSYKTTEGKELLIRFSIAETGDYTVDSERLTKEKVTINGNDGFLFYNEKSIQGSILWGNEVYMCYVNGNISRNELIRVAEGVKY
ncbi:MAG: DUF4367 domain-containing protein [Ruminococcaceae bacterium]|nr:DUF4367 domain-containing protein [Oscillospiraceae bacterium]